MWDAEAPGLQPGPRPRRMSQISGGRPQSAESGAPAHAPCTSARFTDCSAGSPAVPTPPGGVRTPEQATLRNPHASAVPGVTHSASGAEPGTVSGTQSGTVSGAVSGTVPEPVPEPSGGGTVPVAFRRVSRRFRAERAWRGVVEGARLARGPRHTGFAGYAPLTLSMRRSRSCFVAGRHGLAAVVRPTASRGPASIAVTAGWRSALAPRGRTVPGTVPDTVPVVVPGAVPDAGVRRRRRRARRERRSGRPGRPARRACRAPRC